ncbi:MAG: hypothetical protein WBX25_33130 [Rhodomicrobium sp.]
MAPAADFHMRVRLKEALDRVKEARRNARDIGIATRLQIIIRDIEMLLADLSPDPVPFQPRVSPWSARR